MTQMTPDDPANDPECSSGTAVSVSHVPTAGACTSHASTSTFPCTEPRSPEVTSTELTAATVCWLRPLSGHVTGYVILYRNLNDSSVPQGGTEVRDAQTQTCVDISRLTPWTRWVWLSTLPSGHNFRKQTFGDSQSITRVSRRYEVVIYAEGREGIGPMSEPPLVFVSSADGRKTSISHAQQTGKVATG